MTIFSIVKLSELKGAKRIDADRYHVKFLELENNIRKRPNIRKLNSIIVEPVRTGHTPKDRELWEEDKKINFIKTNTLREGFINFDNSDFLPARCLSDRDYLKPKDIIVTIIGADFNIIGRAAIYLPYYPLSVVNQNIAVIKPDINIINPFYLMVFINSKYGREQLWMLSRQTEQVNLNCREVEELLVPLFDMDFQQKIELLVTKSSKFVEKSKFLYAQAEKLLLEELLLKDFKPKYKLFYTANISDVIGVHRADAEYFQPAYEMIVNQINKYINGSTKLLKYAENVKPKYDPTKYPEKTFSYIELANIDSSIGVIHNANEIKGKEAPSRARRILNEGDVIVSSVEGSLEKIALVDKEHDSYLASTGFFQLKPLNMLSEVLMLLSKTIVLQSQLKRQCSGTILTAVGRESLRDIIIPILPIETQQKIASLIQQSQEVSKKSQELLEIAKKSVEIAIEKDEEEALEYISKRK